MKTAIILGLVFTGSLLFACKKSSVVDDVKMTPTDTSSKPTNAHLIYEEKMEGTNPFSTAHGFEIGTWDYAYQVVTNPAFQGTHSARFEIRLDQPLVQDGKRSEVCIVKGADGDITNDTWYSFSAYFPTDGYEYDSEREVINQWYQNGSPATSLRTQADRYLLESGNTMDTRQQYDLGPIVKNTWQEFVLHFIHSYNSDGLIEVWHNGTKVLTLHGGNMYDDVLPKWKLGLYKAAFKTTSSLVTKRVIFFDNIRVGNSNATYDDMTSLK